MELETLPGTVRSITVLQSSTTRPTVKRVFVRRENEMLGWTSHQMHSDSASSQHAGLKIGLSSDNCSGQRELPGKDWRYAMVSGAGNDTVKIAPCPGVLCTST